MGKSAVTIKREKKTFLIALTSTLGVVTDAAKECEISAGNHYLWYNNDEQYRIDVDEIANIALDFVESALFKNVKKGRERSTIFYLERKGRIRGFNNTLDVTTGGEKIGKELDYSNLTEEELLQLQEIHKKLRS